MMGTENTEYIWDAKTDVGWLRLVGSLKLYVSFAKEPYKTVDILQKRPMIGTVDAEYIWDAKTLQLIGSFK